MDEQTNKRQKHALISFTSSSIGHTKWSSQFGERQRDQTTAREKNHNRDSPQ